MLFVVAVGCAFVTPRLMVPITSSPPHKHLATMSEASSTEKEATPTDTTKAPDVASQPTAMSEISQPSRSKQYDVSKLQGDRLAGGGAGFNQFDPILTLSGFISRRFGIVGGLAVVALLASTEGAEILKSLNDKGPVQASGEALCVLPPRARCSTLRFLHWHRRDHHN